MQELFGAGIDIPVKLLRDTSWRKKVYGGREGAARIWKGEAEGRDSSLAGMGGLWQSLAALALLMFWTRFFLLMVLTSVLQVYSSTLDLYPLDTVCTPCSL